MNIQNDLFYHKCTSKKRYSPHKKKIKHAIVREYICSPMNEVVRNIVFNFWSQSHFNPRHVFS